MFQHSIRNKLTAVISALIIATLAIIAYFTLSFFIDRYKTAITTQEYTLLSALGNEIDTKMETAHSILIANAEMLPVNDIDHPEKMQAFLDSRAYLQAVFDSNIFVFSPQGKIIAESPYVPGRRGLDVSYRDYIQMTVSTGKPYISEPYVSTQAKRQPAIMFTAPVFDANHRLVAIFAGSLNLLKSNFIGNLAATRIGKQGYVYLYNRDRIIIIHPEQDRILQKDVPVGSNFLFDEAVHGFEGSGETVNSRGFATLSSFKQLRTKNWILAANHPLAEVYAPIAEVKTYFLLVSLVVLAAVLLGVRLSLKFLTDPLITFTSLVQNMSQKTGTERLSGIKANDEIGALSNAFNDMIQKLDQQKQALVHSEQRYRGIFESAHDAIFVETLDGQIIDANPAACHIMQYSREELMGMSVAQLLPPEVTVTPAERMKQVLAFHSSPFIAENLRKDGSRITFEITSRAFSTNSTTYVVIIARDITERMQLEAELRYLNQHDTLTGLFSRSFFEEESQRLCDKEFSPLGVVICDIDGLKLINDTLGHSAGDYLIRTAANLIRNCFRDTDIVARFGGDEVAILLPNCSKLVIQNACQRISDAIFK
jgi:PAS domain S-box-containing protein